VRGGLVGQEVRHDPALDEAREEVDGVREDADRDPLLRVARRERAVDRGVEVVDPLVAVAGLEAAVDPVGVDLGDERRAASHRDGERLRAAHAAEARGDGELPGERAVGRAEVAAAGLGERLVGPLRIPWVPM
jgi:hypothetical protein